MRDQPGAAIYWLENAPHRPRRSVSGRVEADVVIVGAGFTGLWTAYHLLDAAPSLDVAVVEAGRIGRGASGRNGGFAMTLLDMSLTHLRRNHGDDAARAAHEAVAESVEEIGATIDAHAIDCEWVRGGLMVVATNPGQMQRVESDLESAQALGLDGFRGLSAEEARAKVHSPTYLGALREEHCGVLNPAKLNRGLADVVESMGAAVYEYTPITQLTVDGTKVRVRGGSGEIVAEQVVFATNAWAAHTPWFRRTVVPLYTYINMTEPLSDDQWDRVGWDDHEGIEDKRNYVHYYRRTLDGRILWGGSDGVVYAGGEISSVRDRHTGVRRRLESTFRETFPQLDDVAFTHHWGGPVAITSAFIPMFGTLEEGRLHYGLGYCGHGVAPTHTGGKVLRDKVLGKTSQYTELCFVDREEAAFPPEPLRWMGAELTRRSLRRQDDAMARGEVAGDMDPWLLRMVDKLG